MEAHEADSFQVPGKVVIIFDAGMLGDAVVLHRNRLWAHADPHH